MRSGLVVFLVAVPLCLGIAVASGAPPFAGLIAGIVGGVVVSLISGSALSVSGPAAGLTVIVAGAIATIGTFEGFLAAVVLAGVIQIGLGLGRAGAIGHYIPSSVIKGMLAAIGLILIFKQFPHLIGYDSSPAGDFAFQQPNHENTFSAITHAFSLIQPAALMVGLLGLAIMIWWDKLPLRGARLIPAPLVVVLAGVGVNAILLTTGSSIAMGGDQLVSIPMVGSSAELVGLIRLPDFARLFDPSVLTVALTLAVIASLETLLSVEAVDKLDPERRITPTNRELVAQGAGNIVSGMLGGLPMTAVIVRGAANVNAGARSSASAFFHGTYLLLAVVFIPGLINTIPYASLAAILLVTGYKLTKFGLYREMYRAGVDQFVPFVITVLAIVFTDLLVGIAIGFALGVGFILLRKVRNSHRIRTSHDGTARTMRVVLSEDISFLTRGSLAATLRRLPNNTHVTIDATRTIHIDRDVMELLRDFISRVPDREITVEFEGHALDEFVASLPPEQIARCSSRTPSIHNGTIDGHKDRSDSLMPTHAHASDVHPFNLSTRSIAHEH